MLLKSVAHTKKGEVCVRPRTEEKKDVCTLFKVAVRRSAREQTENASRDLIGRSCKYPIIMSTVILCCYLLYRQKI